MFGTIKRIVKDKGFGFIVPDDGSDEVFFHRSRLGPKVHFEDLREGTVGMDRRSRPRRLTIVARDPSAVGDARIFEAEVQFQVRRGEKGPQAFDLKPR